MQIFEGTNQIQRLVISRHREGLIGLRLPRSQAQIGTGRDLGQPGGGVRLRPVGTGCFRRSVAHLWIRIRVVGALLVLVSPGEAGAVGRRIGGGKGGVDAPGSLRPASSGQDGSTRPGLRPS